MNNLQYPLHITPAMVRALHAYYVAHTRRACVLDARIEVGWVRLLSARSLAGQPVTLEDAQIVIRYLQRRVVDPRWKGPRNPGCLKLTGDNFFCVEKFINDLSEARAILAAHKRPIQPTTKTTVQEIGDVRRQVEVPSQREPVQIDEATAKFLADFKNRKARRIKS